MPQYLIQQYKQMKLTLKDNRGFKIDSVVPIRKDLIIGVVMPSAGSMFGINPKRLGAVLHTTAFIHQPKKMVVNIGVDGNTVICWGKSDIVVPNRYLVYSSKVNITLVTVLVSARLVFSHIRAKLSGLYK